MSGKRNNPGHAVFFLFSFFLLSSWQSVHDGKNACLDFVSFLFSLLQETQWKVPFSLVGMKKDLAALSDFHPPPRLSLPPSGQVAVVQKGHAHSPTPTIVIVQRIIKNQQTKKKGEGVAAIALLPTHTTHKREKMSAANKGCDRAHRSQNVAISRVNSIFWASIACKIFLFNPTGCTKVLRQTLIFDLIGQRGGS